MSQKIVIAIKKLLFELEPAKRIEVIERIGKQLRQQNSIETSREVNDFRRKSGIKKDIDYTPVLPKDAKEG